MKRTYIDNVLGNDYTLSIKKVLRKAQQGHINCIFVKVAITYIDIREKTF